MNTLSSYHNYFKDLAERHLAILHTSEKKHFARINLSKHPVIGAEDLREFFNSMAKNLKTPFVLSVAPEYQAENDHDNLINTIQCEFFIMDKAERGDYDAQQNKMSECQTIAEDFAAEIIRDYEENESQGMVDQRSINLEFVNDVTTKNYCGVKCYLSIMASNAGAKFYNKSSQFNPKQ